jgi:hypothetical protein
MEVYGRGGPVAKPKPAPSAQADGRLDLAGGAWKLQRDSLVQGGGEAISRAEYQDKDWVTATVPGTALTSYLNIGAIPNPDFGDNQLMISDSFFYADFWYRDEFVAPPAAKGKHVWLNFDGINWKADVFLNGVKVGRIEGGFMRGNFDVTEAIHSGARNVLAVRIEKPDTPGSVKEKGNGRALNGGALGADNPTYHAAAGWDWMSTIRGRDCGIWAGVYLTQSGPVTIQDPLVTTSLPLPDTSRADIAIQATLRNREAKAVTGTLHVRFGPVEFDTPESLDASATKTSSSTPPPIPRCASRIPSCGGPTATAIRTYTPWSCDSPPRIKPSPTSNSSRPACASSRTAKRAIRLRCGSMAGVLSPAAETGAFRNPCCATAPASTTLPCATSATSTSP